MPCLDQAGRQRFGQGSLSLSLSLSLSPSLQAGRSVLEASTDIILGQEGRLSWDRKGASSLGTGGAPLLGPEGRPSWDRKGASLGTGRGDRGPVTQPG